jgi:hypothetical protein
MGPRLGVEADPGQGAEGRLFWSGRLRGGGMPPLLVFCRVEGEKW